MYAIIETGGKQYKVAEGDTLFVEKLSATAGETIEFDKVLLVSGENGVKIGDPIVKGATVSARVEEHGRGKKVVVFKYKPKKNYSRKQGHRQPFTKVTIEKINA